MGDVLRGLIARQGADVVADRDTLAELTQFRAVQFLAELGLSDKNDLESPGNIDPDGI